MTYKESDFGFETFYYQQNKRITQTCYSSLSLITKDKMKFDNPIVASFFQFNLTKLYIVSKYLLPLSEVQDHNQQQFDTSTL